MQSVVGFGIHRLRGHLQVSHGPADSGHELSDGSEARAVSQAGILQPRVQIGRVRFHEILAAE
jgi:hypothetical protein